MKVAIIGAGFVGLSAALHLLEKDVDVTLFEKDSIPGGLANGFKEPEWRWSLEKHYHHIFTSDSNVLDLARKVGQRIIFNSPETLTFYDGEALRLDSPMSLLEFGKISFADRVRTGIILLYLKITSNWKKLENITAESFITKWMGDKSWQILWKPLFVKKFGKEYKKISASWFWARIKKRSQSLGYPEGGFDSFAGKIADKIIKRKGVIKYREFVKSIKSHKEGFSIETNKNIYTFDKVICTLPSSLFVKMVKGLPQKFTDKLLGLKGIGAVNLVMELEKPFMKGYWLSINDMNIPFLCVVEQTNYMERRYYDGSRIIYVGNYLPADHEYFDLNARQILSRYMKGLKEINPNFNYEWIKGIKVFKAPYAQPLVEKNYSKKIPDLKTPLRNLFLANIEQVYPWDRGTNYSVELGSKVAELTLE